MATLQEAAIYRTVNELRKYGKAARTMTGDIIF